MNEPKPWLTPKSESLEAFALFLAAVVAVGVVVYLAISGSATVASVTPLVAIFAAVARHWLR